MTSTNRCHYDVLGLQRDCSPDEIRSAYRRLALQRHPDKLVKSGLSQAEATTQFQELQHAYEVLSDPKERAWYDSHRSQILFSDPNSVGNSVPNSFIPNLFSFFSTSVYSGYSDTGKGFYKVYSDVFDKIHANEINFARTLGLGIDAVRQAPVMGNLDSPYAQVTAFYNYWLGFSTVMDFCWVDEYNVMAGPNRKSRRLMEEENSKIRKKAKKEYIDTVRKLAEFVKKRDKRVIDMKMKKNMEMEKKKEEERERKRQLEKEKKARAMAYEEPEWAKVEEDQEDEADWFEEGSKKKNAENEFYCVLCGKKFKSEKQWKNHEQSKKHKEKVVEFRDSLDDEEDLEVDVDEVEVEEREGKVSSESYEDQIGVNDDISGSTDNEIDDLERRVRDGLNVGEEETINEVELNEEEEEFLDAQHPKGEQAGISVDFEGEEDDDESGVLEAILAGRRSRKSGPTSQEHKASVSTSQNDTESDEVGFMEYDNRKNSRKRRGAKKEKGRKNNEELKVTTSNSYFQNEEESINGDASQAEDSSRYNVENKNNGTENEQVSGDKKTSNQRIDKKGAAKDTITNGKNSSKPRKAKGTSKNVDNICEACGEEFESRNKLHKHLGETGHATIKSTRKRR